LDLKNVSTPPPHDFSVGVNCIKKELKLGKPYVNVGDIFGKESKKSESKSRSDKKSKNQVSNLVSDGKSDKNVDKAGSDYMLKLYQKPGQGSNSQVANSQVSNFQASNSRSNIQSPPNAPISNESEFRNINSPDSNKRIGEFDHNSNQDSPNKRRSTERDEKHRITPIINGQNSQKISNSTQKSTQNSNNSDPSRRYYNQTNHPNKSTSSYNATTSEDELKPENSRTERATTPIIVKNEANRQLASNYMNADNLALLPTKYHSRQPKGTGGLAYRGTENLLKPKHALIPNPVKFGGSQPVIKSSSQVKISNSNQQLKISNPVKLNMNCKNRMVQYTLDDENDIANLQPGLSRRGVAGGTQGSRSTDDIQLHVPVKPMRKVTVHRTNSGKMTRPAIYKKVDKLPALTDSPNLSNHAYSRNENRSSNELKNVKDRLSTPVKPVLMLAPECNSTEHVTPPKTDFYQETTQNYSQNPQNHQNHPNHQFQNQHSQNHHSQNQHSKNNNQNHQNSLLASQNLQNYHNVRRTPSNLSNVSNRSEQGRRTNILRKNSSGGKAENKRPYVIMRPKTNSRGGTHKSVGVNCNNLLSDDGGDDFENYGENEYRNENEDRNENRNENRANSQMYVVEDRDRYLQERANQQIHNENPEKSQKSHNNQNQQIKKIL